MMRRQLVQWGHGSILAALAALSACGPSGEVADKEGASHLLSAEVADNEGASHQLAEVSGEVHHDTSPPLTLIEPARRDPNRKELEVKLLPKPWASPSGRDAVLQSSFTNPLLAPTLGVNFDGLGNGFGSYVDCCAPPDTNGDVGPNHFVEIVNLDMVVFNKSGALLFGPVPNNTLWSGFGGGCQTNNDGDPVVLYDQLADRWVISQFSVTTTPYLQCVAVSQTPDPTGAYFRYAFSYGNTDFVDYPKMGAWPDAYYQTYNVFANGVSFSGAKVCAFDRSRMLQGLTATQQCFQLSPTWGGLLPSHLNGATPPPAGSPNYIVGLDAPVSSTLLQYWKFHVDWATPANTTFTGPTSIPVSSYTNSCNTLARGDCIPQGGGGTNLESLADRAMFRLAYRNFGNHEALVFNHTIEVGSGSGLHSGVRWYELRPSGGNLSLFQQGTYAPDSNWRWMGSAALDSAGNIGLGYSVSSPSISPQIHFTGRLAGDALGVMTQGENVVINGGGSQTGGLARWGDYSSMGIDPVDGCTFWYTNEYLKASGSFNWSTRINSFKLPGCGAAPDFSLSATPPSQTVTQGAGTSYSVTITASGGFSGAVTLSASGLPSGASASFSPNPATSTSTMTVTTTSTTATGSFPITITGTSGTLTHTTSVTLVVNPAPTPDFSLSATPASQTVTQGTAGSYTVNVARTGGFTGAVTLSMSSSPAGLTGTFSPNPNTGASSSLSVPTSTSTTPGTYTLTITGTGSGVPTHTTSVTLVVNPAPTPDFSLSATPAAQTVTQGTAGSYTVNVTRTGGFTGPVTLSISSSPAGLTGTFTPNPNTGASSSLSVPTSTSTTPGTYTLTITGSGTGVPTHTTTVTLVVNPAATPDFSLSATPASQTVTQGTAGSYTVNVTRTGGFTGPVNLSISSSPAGLTGTFTPNPNTGASSSLSVPTSTSTTPGTYTLTITGTGTGVPTHTTTVTLVVNPAAAGDFSLSITPSVVSVKAGSTASYTVNITRTGGFTGSITLGSSGLPPGAAASFSPNPATGPSSALSVATAPSDADTTSYTITVTGTSGSLSHSATATLTVLQGCVNGSGDC